MTLRLSEIYTAPQGEGPRVGQMVQFVRFAGCDMRCPGWPCDTQFASNPALWRYDHSKMSADELFEATARWPKKVCLTGGEPFMQNNEELRQYVSRLVSQGYTIEAFSNGSFIYPKWASTINFIMDWKLSGSGEGQTKIENRTKNAQQLCALDVIKFVVCDRADYEEAKWAAKILRAGRVTAQFSIGAAWGKIEDDVLVEWLKEDHLDWTLNVQVHKYIYPPDMRGV